MSPFPRINGHGIVGIVENIVGGARSDSVRVGDRVAVNPFLEYGIELLRGDHPEERLINIVITPTMPEA